MSVVSPKGGTGKTAFITNLAAAFADRLGLKTLLLDLDLQFGDAAIMLGLRPDRTIYDLAIAPGDLDSEKLAGYVTRYSERLEILAAPLRPEHADLVSDARLARLLDIARDRYDFVVVDTSPYFHGTLLTTLDLSDEILVLCAAFDVPTLKNVKLSLDTLSQLSIPPERLSLVLNRFSRLDLKRRDVEATLGMKARFVLPNDPIVRATVNAGTPATLFEPQSSFARAILTVAQELAPHAREEELRTAAATAQPGAPRKGSRGWRDVLRLLSPARREGSGGRSGAGADQVIARANALAATQLPVAGEDVQDVVSRLVRLQDAISVELDRFAPRVSEDVAKERPRDSQAA